jgi:hypothetical protein
VLGLISGRISLAALLALATLLFAVGVTAERSSADGHAEPTASAESGEADGFEASLGPDPQPGRKIQ